MARSSDDAATRAAGDIVAKLLPVLDAFDYAQAHFADADSDEAKALGQARSLMLDALKREGLDRIDDVDANVEERDLEMALSAIASKSIYQPAGLVRSGSKS